MLAVRLLGKLDLRLDDRPLPPLRSARAESVLAYLLLNRDAPQPREQIAFRLWPDSTEPQARTNLRHVLHDLRRQLPGADRYLDMATRTVHWRSDAPCWIDVAAFDAAIPRAEPTLVGRTGEAPAREAAIRSLRDAVELYRGNLLETCYDEWIAGYRDRLRLRYVSALDRLTTLLADGGHHADAIEYTERLLRAEPLREDAYRLLMRLHDARGDAALAIQTYRSCVATLSREVGSPPSAATREAYESLLRLPSSPSTAAPTRHGHGASPAQPPLVGRDVEWARLTSLWRSAERGRTAFVLVSGEAGVGKTRLVEELRGWCELRGAVVAEARSYAAEGTLAYAPLTQWLRSSAITQAATRLDPARLSELTRLVPELSSRVPAVPRPHPLPEDEQRHRLFDATATVLLSLGAPLLLVADDIHWCDQETLRFVHFLMRSSPAVPLLLAATARLEATPRQGSLADLLMGLRALGVVTDIELPHLTREATATLASKLAASGLDAAGADALFHETEGNALFVVEAMRAGWRPGAPPGDAMTPKVHAVIASRLDQLSAHARELAAVAATLGRDFTAQVLAQATDASLEELTRDLDELWRARIIREHASGVYDFSHDRIREVAYGALSPPQRRQFHLRAAEALKRVHGRDPGTASGTIAFHYDRAGVVEEAIAWYETAAEASQHLYASAEAIRLLARGLELLEALPLLPERRARELAILTAMLTPVGSVDGFTSRRLDDIQRRIAELARTLAVDLPPQAARSIAVSGLTRDDFETARRYGAMLRSRGEADGDDALIVEGEYVLGIAAFWKGQLVDARQHFEMAVSRYRPGRRRTHLLRYWLDPQVICLSRLGNTLYFLGDAEAACAARDRALALGAEIGHEHSHRTALVFATLLAVDMGNPAGVRAYAGALAAGSTDRDSRPNRFATETFQAYVRVLDGDATSGITTLETALVALTDGGYAPGQRAFTARLLLAGYEAAGDTQGRLAAAKRMLAMGGAARFWEAELHRVRGECLAELGADAGEVVAALQSAESVARSQGARLLESRAKDALGRFRSTLSRGDRAVARLSDAGI